MEHIFWVLENRLAGRPGPDEVPWDLGKIYGAGFRAMLSLENNVDPAEIKRFGFEHLLAPMPDEIPPDSNSISAYKKLLPGAIDFIQTQFSKGLPVLVHCHAGMDRTGMAIACFLVRHHNMAPEEALSKVRRTRPVALTSAGYEAAYFAVVSSLV
ncbi:MAG: dual specificity protein phosphatase family protein [Caldisericales bacterium]|nr:dual specificity protein phosphatase family protein [Caldisericia bacterium]MCE5177242.1 dual specificity protein phosphatase family protein [bacterium]NMD14194.1 hypothetical protein [Caldisericales bacterium]